MLASNQKKAIKRMFKGADILKRINVMIEGLYCNYGNADSIKHLENRKNEINNSIVLLGWDNDIDSSILKQLDYYSKYK